MARITVEDCLTKETNRFALIHLASKRAKQVLSGARLLLEEKRDNKAIVSSLREIAAGKVRFMSPEEILAAKELENQAREAERAHAEASVVSVTDIPLPTLPPASDSGGTGGSGDSEKAGSENSEETVDPSLNGDHA